MPQKIKGVAFLSLFFQFRYKKYQNIKKGELLAMLEAYSTNVAVEANANIPFNSTSLIKGCTVTHPSPDSVNLNKCGVYMVSVDGTAGTATTIQLYKNGVAQPQAQSTGTSLGFVTLVQVSENNTDCPCTSPTVLTVQNETAGTFDNVNITVTKIV